MKEEYYARAAAEYIKRLGRFCDAAVAEVDDRPLQNAKSEKEVEAAKRAEGAAILQKCAGYVVACDGGGKRLSSEGLARKLEEVMQKDSTVTFAVGGSAGLSPEVLERADFCLSFSEMTFPHRLFRVMLIEQVYRAFKILRGEAYHK